MKNRSFITALLIAAAGGLVACQSTDALILQTEAPLGQAALTGQAPAFEANPSGETTQLTPEEEAGIRADLQASSAPAARQAAADNAGTYRDGIVRLQQESDALTQQRLQRIQGSSPVVEQDQ